MTSNAGKPSSQDLLKKDVLESGLCTGCGACVGLCPYQVIYRGRTVQLHRCDLDEGRCHAFCPRTAVDLASLRRMLFDAADLTPEIGAVKGYYYSRATDRKLLEIAQHGGTVTALMELALAEGMIDSAIISAGDVNIQRSPVQAKGKADLRKNTGSKFTVSPTMSAFNQIASEDAGKIGVVVTPCQALALAKMKLNPPKGDANHIDKLGLAIGLYCGWALTADKFMELLSHNDIDAKSITGMDIPAGKYALELHTGHGTKRIPFADVQACVRDSCAYCFDSTAEYADISVGSARFGKEWEEMRKWNQLIVRSKKGRELVDLAVKRGILEIREASVESLKELKKAASEKKKAALRNIIGKTGSARKLLYLDARDPLVQQFLRKIK